MNNISTLKIVLSLLSAWKIVQCMAVLVIVVHTQTSVEDSLPCLSLQSSLANHMYIINSQMTPKDVL